MMQKTLKMTETLAHGYSSESTQPGLSNKCQQDTFIWFSKKSSHPCALDERSFIIGRVKVLIDKTACCAWCFVNDLSLSGDFLLKISNFSSLQTMMIDFGSLT